jgi:hypothetical protein
MPLTTKLPAATRAHRAPSGVVGGHADARHRHRQQHGGVAADHADHADADAGQHKPERHQPAGARAVPEVAEDRLQQTAGHARRQHEDADRAVAVVALDDQERDERGDRPAVEIDAGVAERQGEQGAAGGRPEVLAAVGRRQARELP